MADADAVEMLNDPSVLIEQEREQRRRLEAQLAATTQQLAATAEELAQERVR